MNSLPNILTATSPEHLQKLQTRLRFSAANAGILDIAYNEVDTPVGPLLLAATEKGLVRVAYKREGFDSVLDTLATKISPRILRAPARLDNAIRQVEEYFNGMRHVFELPLDFQLSHGFRRTVQSFLPSIEYGHTVSYKQLAKSVGSPKAVRAVGTACATNPLPVIVPCHRVLRTDGTLGGYIGGLEAKTMLLNFEKSALVD